MSKEESKHKEQPLPVPIVVLTTRDHYVLAAMQGVLATKSNISPEDLVTRCNRIADEFLR